MYRRSAAYYDVIYADTKDYAAEAAAVHRLLSGWRPAVREVLDVGCGSGEHDRFLARWYEVSGVDLNPELVALAEAKRPGAAYHVADMTTLALGTRYDAVVCLFNAIAYLPTGDHLAAAFRRMAAHLRPGGVLVFEPWHTPDTWLPERSDRVEELRRGDLEVRRAVCCSTVDTTSVFRFEFVVRGSGDEQRFAETHELTLFTTAQLHEAAAAAGLTLSHLDSPPFRRGLYQATHREHP